MAPLTIATSRLSRLRALGAVAAMLALAGCTKEPDSVPTSCFGQPAELMAALRQAPGAVVLGDGTRLSHCVSTARTDADLQSLGISLGHTADALQARVARDGAAALQLGYLAGAVQAGARHATSGVAAQLARRMGQLATLSPAAGAAAAAAWARGARAGGRSG